MSVEVRDRGGLPEAREYVRVDTDLTRAERETSISFAEDDDRARVFTAEAGLMRRLLAHPETEVGVLVVKDGGTVTAEEWDGETIVGVNATLPIGALKVRASARSNDQHAKLISPPGKHGGDRE